MNLMKLISIRPFASAAASAALVVSAAAVSLTPAPLRAQASPAAPAASGDLANAVAALRAIATMRADFIQTDRNGRQVRGVLTLKRPGKIRFQYEKGVPMLVVADGDVIRNDIRVTPDEILSLPLGFDRYTQQTFGNKDFVMNALHYLAGNRDLVSLRSRDIALRLLDKVKIKEDRVFWVLLNTVLPVILLILGGILYAAFRKQKYSKI